MVTPYTTGGESLSYIYGMEKIGDSLFALYSNKIYEIELSGSSATVSTVSMSGTDNSTSTYYERMTSSGGTLYLSGSGSGSYSNIRPVFSVNLGVGDNGSTTGVVTQIDPTFTAASYYNKGTEVSLQYFNDFTVYGSAAYIADSQNKLIRKISVMPQYTFIVTVSNASGNNRFAIDGEEIPAKTLMRGTTYRFMQSDASNNGQPFYIATSAAGAGADAYGTGWTYEGTAGDDGIGLFTVPENAPNTLYYQSSAQAGMGAVLTIEDAPSPSVTIA